MNGSNGSNGSDVLQHWAIQSRLFSVLLGLNKMILFSIDPPKTSMSVLNNEEITCSYICEL
ncbi:hypothetical protein HanPI659440_Chr01g0008741 [Helianthus annuus]|nr:hypothetical protein HanPI659440_Chr01g0008741 [Helianthus annuus]